MRDAINSIFEYTKDVNKKSFNSKELIQDSVIRRIEIIGESVKNVSNEFREKYSDIPGKKSLG